MKYFILFYKTIDNYLEQRVLYRSEHLELAKEYKENGKLFLGGALEDPADSAVLVFKVKSKKEVEEFVMNDPYVKNGLIVDWNIRPWNVVIE